MLLGHPRQEDSDVLNSDRVQKRAAERRMEIGIRIARPTTLRRDKGLIYGEKACSSERPARGCFGAARWQSYRVQAYAKGAFGSCSQGSFGPLGSNKGQ
jgi:hypothetical protein